MQVAQSQEPRSRPPIDLTERERAIYERHYLAGEVSLREIAREWGEKATHVYAMAVRLKKRLEDGGIRVMQSRRRHGPLTETTKPLGRLIRASIRFDLDVWETLVAVKKATKVPISSIVNDVCRKSLRELRYLVSEREKTE